MSDCSAGLLELAIRDNTTLLLLRGSTSSEASVDIAGDILLSSLGSISDPLVIVKNLLVLAAGGSDATVLGCMSAVVSDEAKFISRVDAEVDRVVVMELVTAFN